ncbi:MAG: hypothetical protein WC029_15465 [Sulfuricella sp.]|jgi:hypothetical protein
MDKTGTIQAEKTREIWLASLPPHQVESALALMESLPDLTVRRHPSGHCVIVTYDILDYSLEALESLLVATGHRLEMALLIKIKRAMAYYGEACLRSNLNVPGRERHLRDIYSSKHTRSSDMRRTGKIYYQ